MNIVSFMGGCCGDLITAMIDPTGVILENDYIVIQDERDKLKCPILFKTDQEKDIYINNMKNKYLSLPSHQMEYHIEKKHKIISIITFDFKIALWAAGRFSKLNQHKDWYKNDIGFNSTEEYAKNIIKYSEFVNTQVKNLISLEDIIDGKAVESLSKCVDTPIDKNIYELWLPRQILDL